MNPYLLEQMANQTTVERRRAAERARLAWTVRPHRVGRGGNWTRFRVAFAGISRVIRSWVAEDAGRRTTGLPRIAVTHH